MARLSEASALSHTSLAGHKIEGQSRLFAPLLAGAELDTKHLLVAAAHGLTLQPDHSASRRRSMPELPHDPHLA